jgi:hypothetical protein
MNIAPLLPDVETPVLSTMNPLTPDPPALAVPKTKDPLEVTELYPLLVITLPPLDDDDMPADNTRVPPVPLSPDPTVM